jgi:hypothetical protein
MIRLLSRMVTCGMALLLMAGACVAMPAEAVPLSPAATVYRITGVVVSSVDGAPIPRSHLTPSLAEQRGRGPGRQFPAVDGFEADEHGHFSIPLPSAGAWHLTAAAP